MRNEAVYLVVGVDGLIGGALVEHGAGKRVVGTTHLRDTTSDSRVFLDLTQDPSGWHPPCPVYAAILCAAITSTEYCRAQPEASARFNVKHMEILARNLVTQGAFVVFPSTSLVYDGSVPFRKAEDAVCPQSEYGRQKAEAERRLLALGNSLAVVRFTKVVIGPHTPLLQGWLQALQKGEPIHPFSDMVMAPVSVAFAVDVLWRVVEARLPGILQVSGPQDVSYAQVAHYLAERIGADLALVQPIRSGEAGIHLETVPAHTTLDTTRLLREFHLKPPDVWATIDSVFEF